MKEILKEKGYKATPARLAILEVFRESKKPLTAENIYKKLRKDKRRRNINEATVYRTIATLLRGKIIIELDFRRDASFFELNREHHHHITCVKCHAIENFTNKVIEKTLGGIVRSSSKFISIKDHSLELFGLCKNCA